MFKSLIYVVLMIFLIVILGSVLLEQFPQLVPLWNEFKAIIVELYESSKVKYGTIATIAIIVAVAMMIGTSRIG
ncbi:hypothetical protein [Niallia endozanthoxylica]|uniref:Uncharacterized protein n=1 Tax=Niallia endozanthoxylica TaxID=2036016 RepID=A0A5J5H5B4_9BACI|nr:hypothetical protein [Niallia endozanthoxylica]KAA9014912.1 hypothetical protein F4V44_23230 [Niallia endozanthoxylica]